MDTSTNGKNFVFSNVQLEEGSVATPFEQRPYGLELSLCQRYYNTITSPVYNSATVSDASVNSKDLGSMRASPTVTTIPNNGSGATFSAVRNTLSEKVNIFQAAFNSVNTHSVIILDAEL